MFNKLKKKITESYLSSIDYNRTLDTVLPILLEKNLKVQSKSNVDYIELDETIFNSNKRFNKIVDRNPKIRAIVGPLVEYGSSDNECIIYSDMITPDTMEWSPIEFSGKELYEYFNRANTEDDFYIGCSEIEKHAIKKFIQTYFTGTRKLNDDAHYYLSKIDKIDDEGKRYDLIVPIKLPTLCKMTLDILNFDVAKKICKRKIFVGTTGPMVLGKDIVYFIISQIDLLRIFVSVDGRSSYRSPVKYAALLEGWIAAYNKYVVKREKRFVTDGVYEVNIKYDGPIVTITFDRMTKPIFIKLEDKKDVR